MNNTEAAENTPTSAESGSIPTEAADVTPPAEGSRNADADSLGACIEAILLTSSRPVSATQLAESLGIGLDDGGSKTIEDAIAILNEEYIDTGRSFRIERVAGGYRVMTCPEFRSVIEEWQNTKSASKLSQAALETIAIVAYRQPVTRADIETIRGVACGEVLRNLLERKLLKITGRAEEVGRPMLYGTTRFFLETFGLASLKDLPDSKELKMP